MTATYIGTDDKQLIEILLECMDTEKEFKIHAKPTGNLWDVEVEKTITTKKPIEQCILSGPISKLYCTPEQRNKTKNVCDACARNPDKE